jgi:hypothetical protein
MISFLSAGPCRAGTTDECTITLARTAITPAISPVDLLPGHGGGPAGRPVQRGLTAVALGDFFESYQGIHARQARPARSCPASPARCNSPATNGDFPRPVSRAM